MEVEHKVSYVSPSIGDTFQIYKKTRGKKIDTHSNKIASCRAFAHKKIELADSPNKSKAVN